MRKLILSILAFVLAAGIAGANAGEPATVAAINAASAALDDAFERQSAEDIKRMMTADHIAVTPSTTRRKPRRPEIASLPELKYKQTNPGEVKVVVLRADAGMRTFTAQLEPGASKGKAIPPDVFVTSIMVPEDGQWREKFYQVTALQP